MKERYFEGVKFTAPRAPRSPRTFSLFRKRGMDVINDSNDEVLNNNQTTDSQEEIVEGIRPWSRRNVIAEYRDTIGQISGLTGVELPLDDREIYFIPASKMIPKLPEDQLALVRKYGPYILNGIAGDLTRLPVGFRIRLGFGKDTTQVEHEDVMEILAHEYGHSLGEHIEETIFEEMKADAFAALFMKYYLDVDDYWMEGEDPGKLHHLAKHRVGQLQAMGVSEEEMLAHLTGRPFGQFGPKDWKDHFKPS